MNGNIYFDNAATTRIRPEVLDAMLPYLDGGYGNPSGIYALAGDNKKAVEAARETCAASLGASPDEIYFTSGGTEADNWAIKGAADIKGSGHIITSAAEHHAVLRSCEYAGKRHFDTTVLPVDSEGMIDPACVAEAVRPDTVLITIMSANNEIGVVQPIADIGAVARERNVPFHTDAVAAFGHVPIDVKAQNIDMLSLSAHKIYGPKGVGLLYVRNGIHIAPLLHGGSQEKNHRAGTENVAGIVGLSRAAELIIAEMAEENIRIKKIRDKIIDGILNTIPDVRLNGSRIYRLPGNANFSFSFIEGESLLLHLDMKGICASSGSACTSGSLDPSHVLTAIGLPHEEAHGSLRITIGRYNTEADADALLRELPPIVARLREMSPMKSIRSN